MTHIGWFRTHTDVHYWKLGIIAHMLSDNRFKAHHGGKRSWTIDISEIHRRPFVNRGARDRPMHLPPSQKTQTMDRNSSQFNADNRETVHGRSFVIPSADVTGKLAHHSIQRHGPVIGPNSRGASSGASSSFNPASYTTPAAHRQPSPRRNSSSPGGLPSYSEILPSGDPSEHHIHTPSVDHLVLPSIREVLGPEMHLVEERRRTDVSEPKP